MAAGLSKEQIYRRVRSRLQSVQREFGGTLCTVKGTQRLLNSTPNADGLCFAASYDILHASNGEVAGLPVYEVWDPKVKAVSRKYGGIGITLKSAFESFKAEMGGTRAYVLIEHGRPGMNVAEADVKLADAELLPVRCAQIAAGNSPDVYEVRVEYSGRFTLIREVGFVRAKPTQR